MLLRSFRVSFAQCGCLVVVAPVLCIAQTAPYPEAVWTPVMSITHEEPVD
jgi:hypothetical protein